MCPPAAVTHILRQWNGDHWFVSWSGPRGSAKPTLIAHKALPDESTFCVSPAIVHARAEPVRFIQWGWWRAQMEVLQAQRTLLWTWGWASSSAGWAVGRGVEVQRKNTSSAENLKCFDFVCGFERSRCVLCHRPLNQSMLPFSCGAQVPGNSFSRCPATAWPSPRWPSPQTDAFC